MKSGSGRTRAQGKGWLLFFYRVPSKPVSTRMKVWRRLTKAGSVQVKGAVYILPLNEEHFEFFQWLVAEVSSMGGEAAFTRVETIDSMKDEEIVDLFNSHKEAEYQAVSKTIGDLEIKVNSIRKGSKWQNLKVLSEQITRVTKRYEEILKTDFFSSKTGAVLRSRLNAVKTSAKGLSGAPPEAKRAEVSSRRLADYQGKTWVTRKRPFVDRMASAWLIRRFIDKSATFRLVDENEILTVGKGSVTFDVTGGTFTHFSDLCTFEVLMRSFGLMDRPVRKIAEIIHELDIKDDKYRTAEAAGLEEILSGLRKAVKDDRELLEKGMSVFEMLYLSKAG